jgi:hypothetical protein
MFMARAATRMKVPELARPLKSFWGAYVVDHMMFAREPSAIGYLW